MITVQKAYEIVKKHNPKMKAFACNEGSKFYMFGLIPEDLDEKDGFANSSVYIVDKNTGKYGQRYFTEMVNEPIIREIDVSALE